MISREFAIITDREARDMQPGGFFPAVHSNIVTNSCWSN